MIFWAFSERVASLGVEISLASSSKGCLQVANTEKRVNDLGDLIDGALNEGALGFKDSQILKGKLSFAHAQIFGLSSKYALQLLSEHTYARPFKPMLGQNLEYALRYFLRRLKADEPRLISRSAKNTSFVLTDASFEPPDRGGVGGILCNPDGSVASWFGHALSSRDVCSFMKEGQENAIAELETLAVVIAVFLWANALKSQHAIFCLDNDVSRFALMKGYSRSAGAMALARTAAERCESHTIMPWFLRVASSSNLADHPSRMKEHPLLLPSLEVSKPLLVSVLQEVISYFSSHL